MDTTGLKKFAQEARNMLKTQVGIRLEAVLLEGSDARLENREAMQRLDDACARHGKDSVVDEVAYTWFNRLVALRFMDANGYTTPMVLSPLEGQMQPEILAVAKSGDYDAIIASPQSLERIKGLLTGRIPGNDAQGEAYRLLLVSACNAMNKSMPFLFETIEDYTELLVPDDLLSENSIINLTVKNMDADACRNVEIIGWMYQFYISERRAEVVDGFKKGKKAGPEEIPAATQLFTPDWIVRYLVENSLGRLWMLNHPESDLKGKMRYYIKPVEQETDFIRIKSPEEIRLCDPCCGSGHMLTYAFDLLLAIYEELGYSDMDAVKSIISKNLYGIEIDKRAGQLAYFALMMKAREKDRRFFSRGIQPNICVLENVVFTDKELNTVLALFKDASLVVSELMTQFEHADTYGSLIVPCTQNIRELRDNLTKEEINLSLFDDTNDVRQKVKIVLRQAEYLTQKYQIVVTNPPYMGNSHMSESLSSFIKDNYEEYKSDMFSAFIVRCTQLTETRGYLGFMTPYVWMFISSYEELRNYLIDKKFISSLAQLEYSAFSEATVPLCIFTLKNSQETIKGTYFRLTEFKGGMEIQNERMLHALSTPDCSYRYETQADNFKKIPGSQIAYWASERTIQSFNKTLNSIVTSEAGISTGANAKFIFYWHEVSITTIAPEKTFVHHNKGGDYRKWYGNRERILRYDSNAKQEMQTFPGYRGDGRSDFFKEMISWTKITSSKFNARFYDSSFSFDSAAPSIIEPVNKHYILGFLNSCVSKNCFSFLNPTINYPPGYVLQLPYISPPKQKALKINQIVTHNLLLSQSDWDSFETSWDFKRHPLAVSSQERNEQLSYGMNSAERAKSVSLMSDRYTRWKKECNDRFDQLKQNEEELNRIFIDIYGFQDELKPEEDDSMVSVHRIFDMADEIPESMRKGQYALTKEDVVKSFVSYAVGCMFGRYSLDTEGLAYAGGEWNPSLYKTFIPDADDAIPVLEDEYFQDDIVERFYTFLKTCYGEEHFSENLQFIEDALGKDIRNYFVKDFYKDHVKMYHKRPIYWMFSSPNGSFNCLVYLHRYTGDTVATVRNEYLLEYCAKTNANLVRAREAASDPSLSSREKNTATKNIDKLLKLKKEADNYERDVLYPLALDKIELDLDDGVKFNYGKLGKALKKIPALETSEE